MEPRPGPGPRDGSRVRTLVTKRKRTGLLAVALAVAAATVVARRLRRLGLRRPAAHLLRRDPARRHDRRNRRPLQQGIGRPLHDQARTAAQRRQPGARTAGPPARRRGPLDRRDRARRDPHREFANAGWIEPWKGKLKAAGDRRSLPQRDRNRDLRAPALRGAVQHQHPAALVPQGPGAEAAGRPGTR